MNRRWLLEKKQIVLKKQIETDDKIPYLTLYLERFKYTEIKRKVEETGDMRKTSEIYTETKAVIKGRTHTFRTEYYTEYSKANTEMFGGGSVGIVRIWFNGKLIFDNAVSEQSDLVPFVIE
ncbi:MAG: hypothetical protein Q4G08_10965 [Capnocytophaga sp.]|nr:hypothetical protein [Capnocytophaga sp.]